MVTTTQVIAVLGSQYTNKEAQISELIPLVYGHIRSHCGMDADEEIPAEYDLNAVKMIEFLIQNKAGLTSEGLSRLSLGFSADYPPYITKGLRRKIRW